MQVDAVTGQAVARPLRPFDKRDAGLQRIGKAEFVGFGRISQPVEIEMGDGRVAVIGLHQREGRAGHIGGAGPVIEARADEGAREGRFSRTQITG